MQDMQRASKDTETKRRPCTRAYLREMEKLIPTEENQTEEEIRLIPDPGTPTSTGRNNQGKTKRRKEETLKRKLLDLIEAAPEKSEMIVGLRALVEDHGTTTEEEEESTESEEEGEEEESVGKEYLEQLPNAESEGEKFLSFRQPSLEDASSKMAYQQPMGSRDLNFSAGNEACPSPTPKNIETKGKKQKKNRIEWDEGQSRPPTKEEIIKAKRLLDAAYRNEKEEWSRHTQQREVLQTNNHDTRKPRERHCSQSRCGEWAPWTQLHNRDIYTQSQRPEHETRITETYLPDRGMDTRFQRHITGTDSRTDDYQTVFADRDYRDCRRGPAELPTQPDHHGGFQGIQDDHWHSQRQAGPPAAGPWTHQHDRGLRQGAADESSFHFSCWREMRPEHAQYPPMQENREDIDTNEYRKVPGIPKPYCEFPHVKNHGQRQNVSNNTHNPLNLPADFHRLRPDGGNLLEWNQNLQLVFLREEMLYLVDDPPRRPWTFEVDCIHHKAYFLLIASISPPLYSSLNHYMTVSEIIRKMFKLFHIKSAATTTKLSREFHSAKLKAGTPMGEHIVNLNGVRAELTQRGETITDQSMKSIILNSLDSSWENFILQIDSLSIGKIPLEVLTNKLIAEDSYRRDKASSNKTIKRVEFKIREQSSPECYTCGSRNHYKRDCPRNTRDRGHGNSRERQGRRSGTPERYITEDRHRRRESHSPRDNRIRRDNHRESHPGSMFGLGGQKDTLTHTERKHMWLLDSGATNHTTNNREMLSSFKEENYCIKVANQNSVLVTGKGDAHIEGLGKIEGVLLIPEIPHNILATIKLIRNMGIKTTFGEDGIHMTKGDTEIGSVIVSGGLAYFIPDEKCGTNINTHNNDGENTKENNTETDRDNPESNSEIEGDHPHNAEGNKIHKERIHIGKPIHDNCAHLLHRKLGHASFPVIQKMTECTNGLQIKNCKNYLECSICKSSKIKTKSKPKKGERTTQSVFQLVHMDLVGPMKPSIKYKKRYFLTIVDDYSRYSFVYTLNHKGETFQRFKEFHKRIETQHGVKIKQIMTDRGSEFLSKDFADWLRNRGILHFKSSPFSPFQNGVSERKNGVLQTMTRCVLEDAGLGQHFWAEALTYSNYTLNRLWSSVINKTPYEIVYNRKPKIDHLHIFGVTADVHIPKQLRHKGDKISRRLIFMGYETGTKGYRFIDKNNRFVISRTATFHENANWAKIHLNETLHIQEHTHEHKSENKGNTTEKGKRPKIQGINTRGWKEGHPTIRIDSLTQKEARYMHDAETPPDRPIRSTRNKIPKRLEDYIMSVQTDKTTPNSYREVVRLPPEERAKWELAMDSEMASLRELNVFTPSKKPAGKAAIGTRWVYKIKELENQETLYKARLVAQGFAQRYPEDYTDTYSPTVRTESVKCALVVASLLDLEVYQFDVQTAYLHAELDKEIFVRAPPGRDTQEGNIWKLNKSLYGLKQSGKRWYECLAKVLKGMGFNAITADMCFFIRREGTSMEYVLVYVDDILYFGPHKGRCDDFAKGLEKHFTLKTLGRVNKYLGVQITKTQNGFILSQKEKIIELLDKCNMGEARPCETPMQVEFVKHMNKESEPFIDNTLYRSVIGSLLYIANWTRPDILLAVNLLSRHVSKPTIYHWEGVKRVLKYLKHSPDAHLKLEPKKGGEPILTCYADADWAGDTEQRRSTSGYVFLINECPVYWYTGKQVLVATSTAEAEYICLSKASDCLIWFDDLLVSIWAEPSYPIIIHEDNKAVIDISTSDAVGKRSRHIDIKYKHVRQLVDIGFIKAVHCETIEQVADILTKPLHHKQHTYLTLKLGVQLPRSELVPNGRHLEGDLLGDKCLNHSGIEGVKPPPSITLPLTPPYLDSTSHV